MDAAEHDLDAKLYKASGVLLEEIKHKLPLLLCHPKKSSSKQRLQVLDTKCEELRLLLDRFQEWPQLLDPSLASLVQLLADAFIRYLSNSSEHYGPSQRRGVASTSPLPRAICRILYAFCKVRGYKVIVRLLNNEPRYLAPMLSNFQAWNDPSLGMTWEERYVMLLWLSHLMLAPFELANMSVAGGDHTRTPSDLDLGVLPGIAADVVPLAFYQLASSGKEQQAASLLLVRLSLRKDMQLHRVPIKLVDYTVRELLHNQSIVDVSPYRALGLLSLLYGILNAGSDSEVAPFLEKVFQSALKIASSQTGIQKAIRDFAPARKLTLKIIRVILTHGISLSQTMNPISEDLLNTMLEEGIQHFLDALSDKDTPVRMAAAKALSIIALKLDDAMSAEVIEAVLSSLQENVLLEDPRTQKLMPFTDRASSEIAGLKRNISAVDPSKWHGLMLTLSHFIFRRSPPPTMLTDIIHALILGLEFEQRSNVGTSVGVGVRDAACFGLWAVARKYSTSELALVDISSYAEAKTLGTVQNRSVLQLLACKLAISACSDPSGNIRRGSSAALQELIGRHPDTIVHGISIVQTIDYHAVARLSRAMIEVSAQAAALDQVYHAALTRAFTEWRGAQANDANQRRWAAAIIRILTTGAPMEDQLQFIRTIHRQLLDLKPLNVGTTAGARHGLLLALAAGIQSIAEHDPSMALPTFWATENSAFDLGKLTGQIDGRVSSDLELALEAISTLIGTCSRFIPADLDQDKHRWISPALLILSQCTGSSGKELVVEASSNANFELFKHLPGVQSAEIVDGWLDTSQQTPSLYTSRGRIRSLSLIHIYLAQNDSRAVLRHRILSYLIAIIEGPYKIETRVNAMDGLTTVLSSIRITSPEEATLVSDALKTGLTDYTNDQRGDIGSTLRLQSLDAVDAFRINPSSPQALEYVSKEVMPLVVKLAAEKLNNVRFRAWKCLEAYLKDNPPSETLQRFEYLTEISTINYYQHLLQLLRQDWARELLVLGLISSATAGTEDICRAACNAFVAYLQSLPEEVRQTLIRQISNLVLDQLDSKIKEEDRTVLPLLDFLCFIIDQGVFSADLLIEGNSAVDILSILSRLQTPTSSLPRIEALLNFYSRLLDLSTTSASVSNHVQQSLDKLTRQLLHRWPRVRNTTADLLYLHNPSETLASCDWNGTVAANKPVVLEVRKELGVAGKASAKG